MFVLRLDAFMSMDMVGHLGLLQWSWSWHILCIYFFSSMKRPSAQDVLKRPAAQGELGLLYSFHKAELTHQDFRKHVRTVLRGILPGKPFEVSFRSFTHFSTLMYTQRPLITWDPPELRKLALCIDHTDLWAKGFFLRMRSVFDHQPLTTARWCC